MRRSSAPKIDRESPSVELRLAIGKDGLGMELGRPARLGCLDVTEIAVALAGVRFPLDVSGGVARFRHRRGELKRLEIELDARSLERWAAPKLRGIVSTDTPEVWIAVRRDAATIGLSGKAAAGVGPDVPVLAFEVTLDTHEDDVRLTVAHARGIGLPAPPTALAIAALGALLKDHATREGARFVVPRAATRVARALLPEAGARSPSCEGIRWTMTTAAADAWILHASHGPQADVGEGATRAREAASLAGEGDDARVTGDLVRARALDLAALERAPRHPSIAARVAEIDAAAGGRAEAALAMLREADPDPGAAPRRDGGGAAGRGGGHRGGDRGLRADRRHRDGPRARRPGLRARGDARGGPARRARLAGPRCLARAGDGGDSLGPRRAPARCGQDRRLAEADVERPGRRSRAGRARSTRRGGAPGTRGARAGLVGEAATLFESARSGTRRTIPKRSRVWGPRWWARGTAAPRRSRRDRTLAERRAARGTALIARAIELAEARGKDTSAMAIDLARALAEAMGDRPAAIARVRGVPNGAREAMLARGLEARWRAALGDSAGASVAWARVRDLATARFEEGDARDAEEAAARLLREAADFERDVHGDLALLPAPAIAAALRLRPRDPDLARAYRDVCAQLAPALASATSS